MLRTFCLRRPGRGRLCAAARRLAASCGIGALLLVSGCTAGWAGPGKSADPITLLPLVGPQVEKQRLRSEVEADPFPSADQVGL
jgi:hypothetical protein